MPASPKKKAGQNGCCTWYIHRWTKKKMVAAEYGYRCWPFGGGKKVS